MAVDNGQHSEASSRAYPPDQQPGASLTKPVVCAIAQVADKRLYQPAE